MIVLWIVVALFVGASFGVMLTAGVMLALAVNKENDRQQHAAAEQVTL